MNLYEVCELHSMIIPAKKEKKTTWLFIHGLLADGNYFEDLARSDQMSLYSEIHLIDLRNHGKSAKMRTMLPKEMSMDIRHYIDDKSLGEVNILGVSYGGLVAQQLCTDPDLNKGIKGLLLSDTAPLPYCDLQRYPATFEVMRHMYELSKIKMTNTTSEQVKQGVRDIGLSKRVVESYFARVGKGAQEGEFIWKSDLNAVIGSYFSLFKLTWGNQFEGRVMILKSTMSGLTTIEEDQWYIKEYFSNYDRERDDVYFECPHSIHNHRPQEFKDAFEKFNSSLFD